MNWNKIKRFKTAVVGIVVAVSFFAIGVIAQSLDSPQPIGNAAILAWNANPASDGVTNYYIYRGLPGSAPVKISSTTDTNWPVSLGLGGFGNGHYFFCVSAANPAGESALATNLYVRYFANRPGPPGGLIMKQP